LVKTIGTYEDSAKGISFSYEFDPSGVIPFLLKDLKIKERTIVKTETVKAHMTIMGAIEKYWYLWFLPALVILLLFLIFKK
jgi:hypothetical protein